MQRYFGLSQDTAGDIIPSVAVTVKLAGTGTVATLYSDNTYTAQANPFTSDTDGTYEFYAQDGRYDISLVKAGFTFPATNSSDVLFADAVSVISPPQITADQNDYQPTNAQNAAIWRVTANATRAITGIPAGRTQQMITLVNIGGNTINLPDSSALSTFGNRFNTPTFNRGFILGSDRAVTMTYDPVNSVWQILTPQDALVLTRSALSTTISNSNAETTIFTITVPGGTLGTNSQARLKIYGSWTSNTGIAETYTIRLKYGGGTLITAIATTANGATGQNHEISADLMGFTATNAQRAALTETLGRSDAGAAVPQSYRATSAVDSTADQTLAVSWQWTTASGNLTYVKEYAILEWSP